MTPSYYHLAALDQLQRLNWQTLDVDRLALLNDWNGPTMNAIKYLVRAGKKPGEDPLHAYQKALACILELVDYASRCSGTTYVPADETARQEQAQSILETQLIVEIGEDGYCRCGESGAWCPLAQASVVNMRCTEAELRAARIPTRTTHTPDEGQQEQAQSILDTFQVMIAEDGRCCCQAEEECPLLDRKTWSARCTEAQLAAARIATTKRT